MGITVTTAPCCWGVDDVTNPNLPAWTRVLDEAAAAGYGGLELGPYGYVPLDLPVVSEALTARGLYIVAGTIFDDLVAPARRYHVAAIFKRAQGQGRIHAIVGLEALRRACGDGLCALDLTPIGAPRRDWVNTLLGDGHVILRHPDYQECLRLMWQAVNELKLYAR